MQKKLIGFLIKQGNKTAALKIFNQLCLKLSQAVPNTSLTYLFSILFLKLNTNIEIRKVSYRRRIHFIPIPVKTSRKLFVIFKWLNQILQENSYKIPLEQKLYNEIITVLLLENNSKIIKLKKDTEIKAYNFKSKTHFRWH